MDKYPPRKINRSSVLIFIIIISLASVFKVNADVIFSSTEWDIGNIKKGETTEKVLILENRDTDNLSVEFVSTCDCLFTDIDRLTIKPGEKDKITITFDSSDDDGEFEKYLIIRTNREDLSKTYYFIYGKVVAEQTGNTSTSFSVKEEGAATKDADYDLAADYYYSPGCRSCLKFINKEIPFIEKKLDIIINLYAKDILDPVVYEELNSRLEKIGVRNTVYPVIIMTDVVLQGEEQIDKDFEKTVEKILAGTVVINYNKETEGMQESKEKLMILPVFSAGLLDGVNPCAFTTLIFLLAALAAAGKRRSEVLYIGIFFTLSVFVTYFLIGLGFFKTLRLANSFPVISQAIRWIFFTVLLVFSGLSILDFYKIKKGKANEIILQLPMGIKKRIHKSVRTHIRTTTIIGSSLLMGFFISIFELGCTGQIYFPTIAYILQVERQYTGYIFLGIYNIGFIIPLILVFVLTYSGVNSERITLVFQKNMAKVKIGTAVLFLILAILIIVT